MRDCERTIVDNIFRLSSRTGEEGDEPMRAIVQDRYGSADVLELRDVEDPLMGAEDVLVRVHAAGCGPDAFRSTGSSS